MMEIEILSELDHPHIIKLYETFDEGSDFFIVTELVEGGELFDRIVSKAHYTEKEARDLIKLMLETMAYMHNHGIVHRDLKPENLLLCSGISLHFHLFDRSGYLHDISLFTPNSLDSDDSDIKIADFGFAKRVRDLSPKETACGTPGYVAPEILRGDKYGAEVDVWSMGVICYVLLAGYPPFYDEDQKRLFKKIKEGRYHFHEDYWSNTSPEAINMIQMMLCVDQTKRWTSNQLLKHPWITMGDETLEAKDLTSSIVVMKKFNARRRLKAAADAVIMANRMNRMLGMVRTKSGDDSNSVSLQKKPSLIDAEALTSASPSETDAEDFNRIRTRMSFDTSDQLDEDVSVPAALELLNDKELESA